MNSKSKSWIKRSASRSPALLAMGAMVREAMHKEGRIGNIAMFHAGRCGSTVLGDLLNQHPKIFWDGEIFEGRILEHAKFSGPSDAVRLFIRIYMYRQTTAFYGFETKFTEEHHLRAQRIAMPVDQYLELLRNLGYAHFIVLQRRNYLRKAVSAAVGRKRRQFHHRSNRPSLTRVRLDVDHFRSGNRHWPLLEYFQSLDERYANLEHHLRADRTLKLVYEDDIMENPKAAYQHVCTFLGIESEDSDPTIRLRRSNPFGLPEIVENFDEVAMLLRGTAYEWMLDD